MATLLCPHCGSPTQDFRGLDLRAFTALQARLLEVLAAGQSRFISIENLTDQVYSEDPQGGPEWALSTVRSTIVRLRRKLAIQGWEIESRWGVGYRLVRLVEQAGDE